MGTNFDHIFIFKSNIATEADIQRIGSVLDNARNIEKWTVDTDDDDHVVRIISSKGDKTSIIQMITHSGYRCEELTD